MRNYKKYTVLILSIALSIGACNKDDLSPAPTDSISDLTAFDSELRIVGQVRGIYATMKNSGLFGGRYQIFNDIRGRNLVNERTNVVTGYDIWNYTPSNSSGNSVLAVWSRSYYAINLANVFLDGMTTGKGTEIVGTELSNQLQAEARFLRALNYYALLQFYARPYWDGSGSKPGLPLRLTGNSGTGDYNLARSSVAEVYTQILTDLDFAEQNLPSTYSGEDNVIRAHKNTAIALKTRVYLSMQRYGDVITEADKIVSAAAPFTSPSGVAHELQSDIATVFSNYTTKESILSMPFSDVEAPGTQNQLGYYYGTGTVASGGNGGNAEYSLSATGIISDAGWKEDDARRGLIFTSGSKQYLKKYWKPAPFTDWAPVIRYAEILLNLAEARTRSTQTVDSRAIDLLNAVRGRSDASTVFTAGDFTDWEGLAAAIMTEREIELLGEGFAGADLTRLGLPLPAKTGGVSQVLPTAQEYIWPISSNELLLNELCVDN